MSTTEDRIEFLEGQVRRQRRWNLALSALGVASCLGVVSGFWKVPDVIQAKKFEVVNDEGTPVVKLDHFKGGGIIEVMDRKGVSTFQVQNELRRNGETFGTVETKNGKGKTLVRLSGSKGWGGGKIQTENGEGQALIEIGQGRLFGMGQVEIEDGKGQSLVELGGIKSFLSSGAMWGTITTRNSSGQQIVSVSQTDDGGGSVTTTNGQGQDIVVISQNAGGGGLIQTENGEGQCLAKITSTVDGDGVILTQNGKGHRLVMLGANTDGTGSVTVENGKGQALVKLGSSAKWGSGWVAIQNRKGDQIVTLSGVEHGGYVAVANEAGENVGRVMAIEDGGYFGLSNNLAEALVDIRPSRAGKGHVSHSGRLFVRNRGIPVVTLGTWVYGGGHVLIESAQGEDAMELRASGTTSGKGEILIMHGDGERTYVE